MQQLDKACHENSRSKLSVLAFALVQRRLAS
jgi:hypothetical protein